MCHVPNTGSLLQLKTEHLLWCLKSFPCSYTGSLFVMIKQCSNLHLQGGSFTFPLNIHSKISFFHIGRHLNPVETKSCTKYKHIPVFKGWRVSDHPPTVVISDRWNCPNPTHTPTHPPTHLLWQPEIGKQITSHESNPGGGSFPRPMDSIIEMDKFITFGVFLYTHKYICIH